MLKLASVYSKMFHWIQTTKLELDWLRFLMPLKLQVQMVAECKGKEWFTWVQACQCCALAEKTTRLSSVWWPIRDVLLLCWKTFFSCWHTKALASCLASRSTSRYSALILPLIFPSSVIKVELWAKCNRELKVIITDAFSVWPKQDIKLGSVILLGIDDRIWVGKIS